MFTTHPTARRVLSGLGASLLIVSLGACSRDKVEPVMYAASLDSQPFEASDSTVKCNKTDQMIEITVGTNQPGEAPSTEANSDEQAGSNSYISAMINPDGNFVEDITISDNSTFNFTYSPYRQIGSASAGESDGTYSIKGEGQMTPLDGNGEQKMVPFELQLTCSEG